MRRLVTVLLVLGTITTAAAQTRSGFALFTDPDKRFSLEFPQSWRWMIVSGASEALATFVQPDDEAAVIVERFRLLQPLAPEDITDVFAEIEADNIRENHPRATDISARLGTADNLPVAIIEYTRPGIRDGVQERVRQFSRPVGDSLYRVTCAAVADRFSRYDATFADIVGTLKPGP